MYFSFILQASWEYMGKIFTCQSAYKGVYMDESFNF